MLLQKFFFYFFKEKEEKRRNKNFSQNFAQFCGHLNTHLKIIISPDAWVYSLKIMYAINCLYILFNVIGWVKYDYLKMNIGYNVSQFKTEVIFTFLVKLKCIDIFTKSSRVYLYYILHAILDSFTVDIETNISLVYDLFSNFFIKFKTYFLRLICF